MTMTPEWKYADIVVPLPQGPFTYSVPEGSGLVPGMGVEVVLGRRRYYMGIVWRLHSDPPQFATKPLGRTMTGGPLLTAQQMRLWEWIAEYYMCTLGEVMRAALPPSLKPAGLGEEEFLRDEYRPRTVSFATLGPAVQSAEALHDVCESLQRRARAQYAALMRFCAAFPDGGIGGGEMPRAALGASPATIRALTDKGILSLHEREEATPHPYDTPSASATLTEAQARALSEIRAGFDSHDCVLLYGVTGSGKTEIYTHLIAETLAGGHSVLYLMPEIAMTAQLVSRIRALFGNRVTVYHSAMGAARRAATYRRLLTSAGGELILGARSALFLPLPSPGLIIVDEEHDPSYKQSEPAPRYNARDCAVWLARREGMKCLLASATPSIESYANARGGKYGLVTLRERYGAAQLPRIVVSDSRLAFRRGERRLHFDKALYDRMAEALANGRQVLLFRNRRGFAPWVECQQCGSVARCPRCSVTLTYHKKSNRLECHLCGYSAPLPAVCPSCGAPAPKLGGLGTEKAEEEAATLFPEARILRLDRDTATSPSRYGRIVEEFASGQADILIGTQMVTKGFDFPLLDVVGILDADGLLNFPDFRAAERAFQIMTQVAGRAGRTSHPGEVVIQTSQPDNPLIRQVQTLDYEGMVASQLAERRIFGYPPYGRLITVTMRHGDTALLDEAAGRLAARMREAFGERVYGPHAPMVEKMSDESYREILLKIENGVSAAGIKRQLSAMLAGLLSHEHDKRVTVFCDVDPQ